MWWPEWETERQQRQRLREKVEAEARSYAEMMRMREFFEEERRGGNVGAGRAEHSKHAGLSYGTA